jgi:DNA repair exonuclease SbcCD ATPase subunit
MTDLPKKRDDDITDIEETITRLEDRLQELTATRSEEADAAESKAEAVAAGAGGGSLFEEGDAALEELAGRHTRARALDDVIESVEVSLSEARSELSDLKEETRRRTALEELATLVDAAAQAKEKRDAAFTDAIRAIRDAAERMADAKSDWQEAVTAFRSRYDDVMPSRTEVKRSRPYIGGPGAEDVMEAVHAGLDQIAALSDTADVEAVLAAPGAKGAYASTVSTLDPTPELPTLGTGAMRAEIKDLEGAILENRRR